MLAMSSSEERAERARESMTGMRSEGFACAVFIEIVQHKNGGESNRVLELQGESNFCRELTAWKAATRLDELVAGVAHR